MVLKMPLKQPVRILAPELAINGWPIGLAG
jgi:hypothetical protein